MTPALDRATGTQNKYFQSDYNTERDEMEEIKSYKGFDVDMKCRGKQYEEGKDYVEDYAEACNCGMHACEYPLDCFGYYPPGTSIYHEVVQSGELSRNGDDSKVASTKMRIGARLDVAGIVKAAIDYTKSRTTTKYTDPDMATAGNYGAATAGDYGAATAGNSGAATAGDCGAATAGNYGAATAGNYGAATAGNSGAATAGNYGAATAGDCGAATAGNYGAATAGNYGAATAGNSGAATAGNYGAATAGDYGAATAGNSGAATAGDCGAATSRGKSASGENGLSVARGNNVAVKGGLGAVLVIVEENQHDYKIKDWKAAVVDGEKIKADTWYKLENGEFVEVDINNP